MGNYLTQQDVIILAPMRWILPNGLPFTQWRRIYKTWNNKTSS